MCSRDNVYVKKFLIFGNSTTFLGYVVVVMVIVNNSVIGEFD